MNKRRMSESQLGWALRRGEITIAEYQAELIRVGSSRHAKQYRKKAWFER